MVPKGWTKEPIKNFGDVCAGRQRSPHFTEGTMRPYLRVANVFEAFIDTSDVNEMLFTEDEFQRYKLSKGDILLNEGQSTELVGRPAMYEGQPENCCFQNTLVRFKSNQRTIPVFALQRFLLCLHDGTFQRISKKTTSIAHLGVSRFADLVLIWPPLSEQQKIAQILSTWDQAIATTERLLDLARQQKKALMQQLLTGKKRFPGFEGAWVTHLLEDLEDSGMVELGRGNVISKTDIENYPGDFPIYSSSVKNNGLMGVYGNYMFDEELISWSVDGGGDFFHRNKHKFSVTNVSGYMRINTERLNYKFIASQLQLQHSALSFDYQSKAHPSVIRKLYRLAIPAIEEQVKIAEVLTTADQEVETLQSQLDGLKQEKKALMQTLLTGKRRVSVDE